MTIPSCLTALALVSGCTGRPAPPPSAASNADAYAVDRAAAYERVSQRFQTAAFLRPKSDPRIERRLTYLAPLIMQEPEASEGNLPTSAVAAGDEPALAIQPDSPPEAASDDDADEADPPAPGATTSTHPRLPQPPYARFGAVRLDERGQPQVDVTRPTVYFFPSQAHLSGQAREQWTFVWFYPPAAGLQQLRWRGYRMTLDAKDLPMIWEVVSDRSPLRVLYVSAGLAVEANRVFDGPLPGRRYAIESALADYPQVAVARLLSDGPQAMGPYVYLGAQQLTLTTIHCRCSPTQVDRWFAEVLYDLVRLGDVSELGLGAHLPPHLGLMDDPAWLEQVLRLPPASASAGSIP